MRNRSPYTRESWPNAEPDMYLAEEKTCGDCVHLPRCRAIYGRLEDDEVCDWSPSRFQESPK
jgi:hypothetical protein